MQLTGNTNGPNKAPIGVRFNRPNKAPIGVRFNQGEVIGKSLPIDLRAAYFAGGRISSTASAGRHSRVPSGVTTMGRLIRMG